MSKALENCGELRLVDVNQMVQVRSKDLFSKTCSGNGADANACTTHPTTSAEKPADPGNPKDLEGALTNGIRTGTTKVLTTLTSHMWPSHKPPCVVTLPGKHMPFF